MGVLWQTIYELLIC